MKRILILFLFCFLLCGCGKEEKIVTVNKMDEVKEIMKENNYVIVDVRTKEEYKEAHLKGAINISVDEITENVELDKLKTIFVYCKSGNRSKIAFNKLKEYGYTVYDLGAFSTIDLPKE